MPRGGGQSSPCILGPQGHSDEAILDATRGLLVKGGPVAATRSAIRPPRVWRRDHESRPPRPRPAGAHPAGSARRRRRQRSGSLRTKSPPRPGWRGRVGYPAGRRRAGSGLSSPRTGPARTAANRSRRTPRSRSWKTAATRGCRGRPSRRSGSAGGVVRTPRVWRSRRCTPKAGPSVGEVGTGSETSSVARRLLGGVAAPLAHRRAGRRRAESVPRLLTRRRHATARGPPR